MVTRCHHTDSTVVIAVKTLTMFSLLDGTITAYRLASKAADFDLTTEAAALVKEGMDKPGMADWNSLYKLINYTRTEQVQGYECSKYTEITEDYYSLLFDTKDDVLEGFGDCKFTTFNKTVENCDEDGDRLERCRNGALNPDYGTVIFDGTTACVDMLIAIKYRFNALTDEEYAYCDKGRRLPAEIAAECDISAYRWEQFYSFTGMASPIRAGEQDDMLFHQHAHQLQDNHSQFRSKVGLSTYVKLAAGELWYRAGFEANAATEMYESSYIYRCEGETGSYIHVKGRMKGRFLFPKGLTVAYSLGNMCPIAIYTVGRDYQERRGTSVVSECFMDINISPPTTMPL